MLFLINGQQISAFYNASIFSFSAMQSTDFLHEETETISLQLDCRTPFYAIHFLKPSPL